MWSVPKRERSTRSRSSVRPVWLRTAQNKAGISVLCAARLADGTMHTPHLVSKGEYDFNLFDEVASFVDATAATFSVQSNAWFDERMMLEWIDKVCQYEVIEPALLLLDSLKVHKCAAVRQRQAEMGTAIYYILAECTLVSPPLDVGVMGPFKKDIRDRFEEPYSDAPAPTLQASDDTTCTSEYCTFCLG